MTRTQEIMQQERERSEAAWDAYMMASNECDRAWGEYYALLSREPNERDASPATIAAHAEYDRRAALKIHALLQI